MNELLILLLIIIGLLGLVALASVLGGTFAKYQFQNYKKSWGDIAVLQGLCNDVGKELEEFAPYLRIPPDAPPFTDNDLKAFAFFQSLSQSSLQVINTLENLPQPNELEPQFNWIPLVFKFKGWGAASNTMQLIKDIQNCIQESNQWGNNLEEIIIIKEDFRGYHESQVNMGQWLLHQVNDLEDWLQDILDLGISDLDSYKATIRWLSKLLDEVREQLTSVPILESDTTVITKYRLIIRESFFNLTQIADTCREVNVDFHRIDRARKWSQIHLMYITSFLSEIKMRLEEAGNLGLDIGMLLRTWNNAQLDSQNAKTYYVDATPKAYENLCGDLVNRGSNNSLLIILESKIEQLENELSHVEETYKYITRIFREFYNDLETERDRIQHNEIDGYKLDLSRKEFNEAENILINAERLIKSGILAAFENIPPLLDTGKTHIIESINLREEFQQQRQELPILLEKLSFISTSLPNRILMAIQEMGKYNYKFDSSPAEMEGLSNGFKNSFKFISDRDIEHLHQSTLRDDTERLLKLDNDVKDFVLNLEDLEKTLTNLETQYHKIEVLRQEIEKKWNILTSLSQEQPLEVWLTEFMKFEYKHKTWEQQWQNQKRDGAFYQGFLQQAEEMKKTSIYLENLFYQHRDFWSLAITEILEKDRIVWDWIDLRTKRKPTPSVVFHEHKRQMLDYRKEAKSVLAHQFPDEMKDFADHMGLFVQEINDQRNIVEREEESFTNLMNDTTDSCKQAVELKERIKRTIDQASENLGKSLKNETVQIEGLIEELNYHVKNYNEVTQEIKYLSIEKLIFKLENLNDAFREIRRSLFNELHIFYNYRDQIRALNDILEERLNVLLNCINDYNLRPDQIKRVNKQIEGVSRLKQRARDSSSFGSSITLINQAIELANWDLPSVETVNNYLSFADRQVNVTGGFYNEGINQGVQVGGDAGL